MSSMRVLTLAGAALLAVACSSGSSGKSRGGAGNAGQPGGVAGSTGAAGNATGTAGNMNGAAGTAGAIGNAGAPGSGGITAAAGATGNAGAVGTAGAPAAGGAGAVDTTQSVLTRNKHETRDGFFIQPTLTKAMAMKMAPDTGFMATFQGTLWGAPLYVENGPSGMGAFIAVSTNNSVYAFNETTGATLWTHSIGTAPNVGFSGCGNTTGITSTPVIDLSTRTIYVAGVVTVAGGGVTHQIHALELDTGNARTTPGWPIDVSTLKDPTGTTFKAVAHNQRSALSLVNGTLYVAFGGHVGDCNQYHGWVIAVNTADPTKTGAWATAGNGEAIWASGGMASDGTGVFAVTGNRNGDSSTHQDSEEVVHITGLAQLDRTTGVFYPGSWRSMDGSDLDFGSASPVVISVPGSMPSTLVAAASKNGHFYLLNPANLGGMDGQLQDLMVAGNGMNIRAALAAYNSGTGVHVVFNTLGGASCGRGMLSIGIAPGNPPVAKEAWCTPKGGDSSPIATSTDGTNETIVWFMDGSKLNGIDADTGMAIVSPTNPMKTDCSVKPWSSPIAVKGRIVSGGAGGTLCSWSPH
jgi:hypothetical protein